MGYDRAELVTHIVTEIVTKMDVKERMKRYRARKRGEAVPKLKPGRKVGASPYVESEPERKLVHPEIAEEERPVEVKAKEEDPATNPVVWREKRLGGGRVFYECRRCGTWYPARHGRNCEYGKEL